jgi:hypothetical protein
MTGTKKTVAMFGGAAALAFAVGLGGVGVNAAGSNPTTGHPSSSVIPATAASGSSTGSGSGVHSATLVYFYTPRTCTPAPCR